MIPAQLKACEGELRKAIAQRQYDEVALHLNELSRAADKLLKHSHDAAARREIAGSILETIEWARRMIVAQRQSWAEELEQLPQVGRFLSAPENANAEVCVDL